MATKTLIAAAVGAASLAMNANAELIAGWNFSNYGGSGTSVAASHGSGTLSLAQWGGSHGVNPGTSMNAIPGGMHTNALELQRGNPAPGGNGTPISLTFSMSGMQDLTLSFATAIVGNANHAFTSGTWSWSIDGVNFTAIAGSTHATTDAWQVKVVDLSGISALNDASNVTLRYVLSGASHQNGRNAIDNIQLNAALIPAPGALALLGVASLVGVRRRRR